MTQFLGLSLALKLKQPCETWAKEQSLFSIIGGHVMPSLYHNNRLDSLISQTSISI